MLRRFAAVVVMLVLVLAVQFPASAATWFQLRINPSSASWTGSTFGDIPMTWNTTMWGFTALVTPPGRPWGLRVGFDTGNQTNLVPSGGFDYSDSSGTWTVWDVSVAYTTMAAGTFFSLFAGYGNNSLTFSGPSYGYSRQITSGLVLGGDFKRDLAGGWYITGSVVFGPSQNYTYEIGAPGSFLGTPGTAQFSSYSIGLGRAVGMGGLEVGWRSAGFTGSGTGSSADGANIRWSGWYVGFSIMR